MATIEQDKQLVEELNRKHLELDEEFSRTASLEVLQRALGFIQQAVDITTSGPLSCSDLRVNARNNLGRCQRRVFEASYKVMCWGTWCLF